MPIHYNYGSRHANKCILFLFHYEVFSYSEALLDISKIIRGWELATVENVHETVVQILIFKAVVPKVKTMLTWHRTTALQNDGEKTISAFEIRPPFCRRSHLTSSNKGEAQNPSCSEKYPPCLSFSSLCPRHFSITICQGLPRLVPHSPYSRLIIHPPQATAFSYSEF